MPLAYVLDSEIGIGYRQDITKKGLHPYLEDLELPLFKEKSNLKIEINPIQQILNEKLQEALLDHHYKIELSDDDFKDFEEDWSNLPDTLSFISEIVSDNTHEKLFIGNGGGSSGANLLGRFCSEKSEIHNLTKAITQKEEKLNPSYILAEVIHLPEARIGNIIRRPTLRNHEIAYLAKSTLPVENQIFVDDLSISLKNDRIILYSKKLGREIKPCLTNAHNYSENSLPVYHFLCDLQSQNNRPGLYFNWGDLKNIYKFLPRVEYKNVILSKALWKITNKEITTFVTVKDDKEKLLASIKDWRIKNKIPQWIQWVKFDNKLTIDLENFDLLQLFIAAVKNEKSIIIEEVFFNENDDFRREYIFSIYKGNL